MQKDKAFLGYLVYRRQYDDFLCRLVLKRDYTLTAWSPEPWRSTIFTEERARYASKVLHAEICPIYDHGDHYWVLFEVPEEHSSHRDV